MLKGIDISYFQGDVNFSTLKSQIDFVIIRASYGVGYIDKKFAEYREQARANEIPVGFYHYSYPQYNSPEQEAEWFLQTLGTVYEGDILCLDYEEKWGGDVVDWCKRFLDTISANLNGYKPLIYLNKNLIQSYNWSPVVNAGYGLWVAHYDEDPFEVHFNTPWSNISLKQYTDCGKVNGIDGNVDKNTLFGELMDLKLLGYQTPKLPEEASVPNIEVVEDLTEIKSQPLTDKLKDRRFLLSVGASIITFINAKFNVLGLNQLQFLTITSCMVTLILIEGLIDLMFRVKNKSVI